MLDRPSFLTGSVGVAAVLAMGCAAAKPNAVTALPSEPVVTLDGVQTELGRLVQGRAALVSFWATWCTSCDKEIDALNRLSERAAARGDGLVVGVAVGEPRAKVDAFVRVRGVRYLQVLDKDFRLADALGQRDIPATLVVDRTGRIVYRGDALDRASLAAFRKTLGEP
jgi:thiol-disulfide isomerase/thioredoxin